MNLKLSLNEMLYKDYKKFFGVGYSVIFVKLEELLMKYNEK